MPDSPQDSTTWGTAFDESFADSPRAFTALQEPWPPTRCPSPDDNAFAQMKSEFNDDNNSQDGDESDSGTATPSVHSRALTPQMSPSELPPRDSAPAQGEEASPVPALATNRSFGGLAPNSFLKRQLGGMLRETRRSLDATSASLSASLSSAAQDTPTTRETTPSWSPEKGAGEAEMDAPKDTVNLAPNNNSGVDVFGTRPDESHITPPTKPVVIVAAAEDESTPLRSALALEPEAPAPTAPEAEEAEAETSDKAGSDRETREGEDNAADQPPSKRSKNALRPGSIDESSPSSETRTRRPVANFGANPAFRRQLQSFLPPGGVVFKPSRKTEEEAKAAELEEVEAEVEAQEDQASAEVSMVLSTGTSDAAEAIAATEALTPPSVPANVAVSDPATHEAAVTPTKSHEELAEPGSERLRSPPKNERDAKKLKPTAAPFVPTAPVTRPATRSISATAPAFKPGTRVISATAAPFQPAAPTSSSFNFKPTAAAFTPSPGFSFAPAAPAFVPSAFQPVATPFQPVAGNPGFAPAFAPAQDHIFGHERRQSSVSANTLHQRQPSGVIQSHVVGHTRQQSSVVLSTGESSARLRPTALPFQPGSLATTPTIQDESKGSINAGGALGLFTFTHKLRPTAAEWKPAAEEPTVAQPAALPVVEESEQTSATVQESPVVPRRDVASPRAVVEDIERPISAVSSSICVYSADNQIHEQAVDDEEDDEDREPRRRKHTARRSSQNSYRAESFSGGVKSQPVSPVKETTTEGGADVQIQPSRPIRGRHSSGRKSSIRSIRSVKNDSITEISAEMEEAQAPELPMPGSAETFSPIAQLPSDIEDVETINEEEGTVPTDAVLNGGVHMSRESLSAPGRLDPTAKPFIFGATPSTPPPFDVTSPAKSAPDFDALHSTPSKDQLRSAGPSSSSPSMPNIRVELADDSNNKFRKWVFPSASASSVAGSSHADARSEHAYPHQHQHVDSVHRRSHSDITEPDDLDDRIERSSSPATEMHGLAKEREERNRQRQQAAAEAPDVDEWLHWTDGNGHTTLTGGLRHGSLGLSSHTSAEFPLRASPPRVLAVVNDDPKLRSGGFMSPTIDDMPLGDDPAPEILHLLHKIEEQVASLRQDADQMANDNVRRVDDANTQTSIATEALDLIKGGLSALRHQANPAEYIPDQSVLAGVTAMLGRQTTLLEDIQRKVEEEVHRTPTPGSDQGDTTLVENATTHNDMFKALIAGQEALMVKFAEYTEAQGAVSDLRSVTDALLEAQSETRAAKAAAEATAAPGPAEFLAEQLAEAQRSLRDETARSHRAEQETAAVQRSLQYETDKAARAERELAVMQERVAELEERARDRKAEAEERAQDRKSALERRMREKTAALEQRSREDAFKADLRAEIAAATASFVQSSRSEEQAKQEMVELREFFAKQSAQQEEAIRALKEEVGGVMLVSELTHQRDIANRIAEERHHEIIAMQKDSTSFRDALFDRLAMFERTLPTATVEHETVAAERVQLEAEHAKVASLEKEVERLRVELVEANDARTDLRVQLAQANANTNLEQEKAVRVAETEATARRSLEIQLNGEKGRTSYLEKKATKLETELHEVNQNLDVWRSAALEQRLRAEQSAVS